MIFCFYPQSWCYHYDLLKAQMTAFLVIKSSLIEACALFFRHNAVAHLSDRSVLWTHLLGARGNQNSCVVHFIVVFTLLKWPGARPATSLRFMFMQLVRDCFIFPEFDWRVTCLNFEFFLRKENIASPQSSTFSWSLWFPNVWNWVEASVRVAIGWEH